MLRDRVSGAAFATTALLLAAFVSQQGGPASLLATAGAKARRALSAEQTGGYATLVIVGAGPAGLQWGLLAKKAGLDYVILERGPQAGHTFSKYPRKRRLISANKRNVPGYGAERGEREGREMDLTSCVCVRVCVR